MRKVEYKNVRGHIEVYEDNEFIFSEDTLSDAKREYESNICDHTGRYCGNDACPELPVY